MNFFQPEYKEKTFLLPPDPLAKKPEECDSNSQLLIGLIHYFGMNNCVINKEKAYEWIRSAAKSKDSPAGLHAQGLCYALCIGGVTIKNMDRAKEFYLKAIEEKYIPAMHSLAAALKDDEESNITTSKGAAGGIYSEHKVHHIDQDRRSIIIKLYTTAAEAGFPPSINALGKCYYNGFGVKTDLNQAFKLFQTAANTGLSGGKDSLGVCYRNGAGVKQDNSEARRWHQEAAQQGCENAIRNLENMSSCCLIL